MEREPASFNERRISNLEAKEITLLGQLNEVRMEIQRLKMGRAPQDLSPIFKPGPQMEQRDEFWSRQTDPEYTKQANQQSDNLDNPPYPLLLQ